MKVPLNNLSPRLNNYRKSLMSAFGRVVDSGSLILGPEVMNFEEEFAKYLVAEHCVGVANGTDAIELALRALGIDRGDEVATVANAGMYTTSALLAIGAQPFFMDVDLHSKNVSFKEVEKAIKNGCKAIVITHLYGLAVTEMLEIAELCKAHNVQLLEDCAQAHGAKLGNQRVGTFGDAASFSFYPTKNLGALGDGGAVVTNNSMTANKVLHLRQYGWSSKYDVLFTGGRNSRLDSIQAAMLSIFLPDLDSTNERRRAIASQYSQGIKHANVKTPSTFGEEYVSHLYVIQSDDREALRRFLLTHEVNTDVHYPTADHRQSVFGDRYHEVSLPNTEKLCDEILTLPCYPEMSDEQVVEVIRQVNSW